MPFTVAARVMQTPAPDLVRAIEDAVIVVNDLAGITAVERASRDAPCIAALRVDGRRVVDGPR